MEIYVLTPPEPITVGFYRCDARFHVEPLLALVVEKDTYGIIVIDGTEAVVATLKGRRVEIIKSFTSGIPGKSRAGGQSASRRRGAGERAGRRRNQRGPRGRRVGSGYRADDL